MGGMAQNAQIKKTGTVRNKRKKRNVSIPDWSDCTVPGDGKGIDGKPCTWRTRVE